MHANNAMMRSRAEIILTGFEDMIDQFDFDAPDIGGRGKYL